jgi:hypothetical protein
MQILSCIASPQVPRYKRRKAVSLAYVRERERESESERAIGTFVNNSLIHLLECICHCITGTQKNN